MTFLACLVSDIGTTCSYGLEVVLVVICANYLPVCLGDEVVTTLWYGLEVVPPVVFVVESLRALAAKSVRLVGTTSRSY